MDRDLSHKNNYIFVFIEVFACEGGIQSYVKDIFGACSTLDKDISGDVFLLRDTPNPENPYVSKNLNFHYFKSSSPQVGRVRMATALLLHILRQRPSHVFCGHINLAPLISILCHSLNIPYTVITYGKEVWEPLTPRAKTSLQKAAGLWTISRYTRKLACGVNQLDEPKFKILPPAIDGDRLTPGEKSPALLERYGLTGKKVLMTVARLWSGDIYKGVDVTIRALGKIAEVFPEVKYLVIGRGDDQPRLAKLAEDLGVSDRVVFAGFVPNSELIDHYRLADAYVMPSQEGFGIVYLEAMACGIPVLSGDNDGSADPLQDGKLGWQVPYRDENAVAQACIEMLTGKDQRCDGEWLREQAIAYFGMDGFQRRIKEAILGV
jgi:glycosyltransferase involved in cell wall biosynthesis